MEKRKTGQHEKALIGLRFLGGAYHGWQVQKNKPSVQAVVQTACEELLGAPCAVTGCSRTDAGVHARQYFCTVDSRALSGFPVDRLPFALNRLLPDDVSAFSARAVPADFHPRYDAKAKEYEYLIFCADLRDAFWHDRAYHAHGARPDAERMAKEAKKLVGTHDFTSFCASGGKIGDKTRTVYFCTVKKEGDLISVRVCADGFLYNMVRIIAGTLLECGQGKELDCASVLAGRDRALAGRTAPAHGLYLDRVYYDAEELEDRIAHCAD